MHVTKDTTPKTPKTKKPYHATHPAHDVVGFGNIEKRFAGNFARATVVSEDLHHAHASINVDFAAAGSPFVRLAHLCADCGRLDRASHCPCVADVDGFRQ